MPSTDRKPELKAKTSVAQTASQPAVCSKGLIAIFTFWMWFLWGSVRCCQHSPASVSGSSASLGAAWLEKLLPLLPWCSVSSPPLSLVYFRTPWSSDTLRGRNRRRWGRAILQAIQYFLLVKSRELGTSRWRLSLQSPQCEPRLWFQQDGATDTIFRKWILQLKFFEIKLTLAINSLIKIVHFSFYFNLKNRQVFLPDPVHVSTYVRHHQELYFMCPAELHWKYK
jgi:hypothetical protein